MSTGGWLTVLASVAGIVACLIAVLRYFGMEPRRRPPYQTATAIDVTPVRDTPADAKAGTDGSADRFTDGDKDDGSKVRQQSITEAMYLIEISDKEQPRTLKHMLLTSCGFVAFAMVFATGEKLVSLVDDEREPVIWDFWWNTGLESGFTMPLFLGMIILAIQDWNENYSLRTEKGLLRKLENFNLTNAELFVLKQNTSTKGAKVRYTIEKLLRSRIDR